MFKIIADARERAVLGFFKELSESLHIDFEIKTITTGDYAIIKDDKIIFIFERKTWQDLAASMRDGRKENVNKLLNLRESNNCKIAYIIEGDPFPTFSNENRLCNRIPYKNLISHLDHLMFRDDIHIIYTKNEEHTARKLFSLTKNIISCKKGLGSLTRKDFASANLTAPPFQTPGPLESAKDKQIEQLENAKVQTSEQSENTKDNQIEQEILTCDDDKELTQTGLTNDNGNDNGNISDSKEEVASGGAIDKLTVKQTSTVPIAEQILKCLPGIGSIISVALAENGVSIASLFQNKHSAEDLAVIKYPSGAALGMKKATQIVDLPNKLKSISATAKKIQVKILYSIPLITKKTASVILSKFSFATIMSGAVSAEQLSEIKKTEKVKLGKKAAENILHWLKL